MKCLYLGYKNDTLQIMGSTYGDVYAAVYAKMENLDDPYSWDEKYPDWRKGFVHLVVLKEPQKQMSREECKKHLLKINPHVTEALIDYEYDKLPSVKMLYMPQDAIVSQEEMERDNIGLDGFWSGPKETEPQ